MILLNNQFDGSKVVKSTSFYRICLNYVRLMEVFQIGNLVVKANKSLPDIQNSQRLKQVNSCGLHLDASRLRLNLL